MTSKKLGGGGGGGVNETCTVHRLLFLKKLTRVFFCHKDFKKHLLIKVNIKKMI